MSLIKPQSKRSKESGERHILACELSTCIDRLLSSTLCNVETFTAMSITFERPSGKELSLMRKRIFSTDMCPVMSKFPDGAPLALEMELTYE